MATASAKETTCVSFVCQRCYQPLKMDSSIYSLDSEAKKELESSFYLHSKVIETQSSLGENTTQNWYDNFTPPVDITNKTIHSAASFDKGSDKGNMDSLSNKVRVSTELFDIMSGASDIDHPLCEECTDNLLDLLNDQLLH